MTLRKKVQAHYADRSLPAQRLADLAKLAEPPRRSWLRPQLAAGFLIASTLILFATRREPAARLPIADEVARNHRSDYPAEFVAQDYAELGRAMTRLDFALERPQRNLDDLELHGARYCTLAGRIAAQVRLEDAQGRTATLYAARAGNEREQTVRFRDLEVRVWREGDLLFGLARPLR